MFALLNAIGVPARREPVTKQALAPVAKCDKDCNQTRPYSERNSGAHCVVARFPKTGSTLVSHVVRNQNHVTVRSEDGGELAAADFTPSSYVIGQTRHPVDWYSSLWAYLSDASSAEMSPHHIFSGGTPREINRTLSQVIPRGSTSDDVHRFRAFVQLYTAPKLGAFSLHFYNNYINVRSRGTGMSKRARKHEGGMRIKVTPGDLQARDPKLLERAAKGVRAFRHKTGGQHGVKCFVRQENLFDSLQDCLANCERALDSELIDWESFEANRDLVINPSTPRVANAVLYDEATTKLVQERDADLLAFFGYNASDTSTADRRLWIKRSEELSAKHAMPKEHLNQRVGESFRGVAR